MISDVITLLKNRHRWFIDTVNRSPCKYAPNCWSWFHCCSYELCVLDLACQEHVTPSFFPACRDSVNICQHVNCFDQDAVLQSLLDGCYILLYIIQSRSQDVPSRKVSSWKWWFEMVRKTVFPQCQHGRFNTTLAVIVGVHARQNLGEIREVCFVELTFHPCRRKSTKPKEQIKYTSNTFKAFQSIQKLCQVMSRAYHVHVHGNRVDICFVARSVRPRSIVARSIVICYKYIKDDTRAHAGSWWLLIS